MAAPSRFRLARLRPRWGSRIVLPRGRSVAIVSGAAVSVALAVVGAFGLFRYVDTYWLYRGFPPPHLPASIVVHDHGISRRVAVIPARVQTISVRSPALGGYRDPVDVVLPPGYGTHPARRYPVLYLLHGSPGEPANFLYVGRVQDVEATLIAAGRMKPLILVIPSGGRSFFSNRQWANNVGRRNHWETFVARDLVRAIDARYRTIRNPADRGLAGLSEGGYGALNIGLHHPGEFRLLESWSGYMRAERVPAVYPVFHDNPRLLAYNSPEYWLPHVAARLRADRTYIWFYCGTSDPSAHQDRYFDAELHRLHIRHHFFERRGGHDWALWRREMAAALRTASEQLSDG
jgi:S-formylglutathione hydrolase FrmB